MARGLSAGLCSMKAGPRAERTAHVTLWESEGLV